MVTQTIKLMFDMKTETQNVHVYLKVTQIDPNEAIGEETCSQTQ